MASFHGLTYSIVFTGFVSMLYIYYCPKTLECQII